MSCLVYVTAALFNTITSRKHIVRMPTWHSIQTLGQVESERCAFRMRISPAFLLRPTLRKFQVTKKNGLPNKSDNTTSWNKRFLHYLICVSEITKLQGKYSTL